MRRTSDDGSGRVQLLESSGNGTNQVDLVSDPVTSDFFGSALQGLESKEFSGYVASGARPRRHKEVSLRTGLRNATVKEKRKQMRKKKRKLQTGHEGLKRTKQRRSCPGLCCAAWICTYLLAALVNG